MATKKESGVSRAVAALGGQVKTAERFKVSQQAVSAWVRRGYMTRMDRVLELSAASGVPAAELVNSKTAKLLSRAAA